MLLLLLLTTDLSVAVSENLKLDDGGRVEIIGTGAALRITDGPIVASLSGHTVDLSEGLKLRDGPILANASEVFISESLKLSDGSPSVSLTGLTAAITDGLKLDEGGFVELRGLGNPIRISDTISAALSAGNPTASFAESLKVSDQISVFRTGGLDATISETLYITDFGFVEFSKDETLKIADFITAILGDHTVSISEGLRLNDGALAASRSVHNVVISEGLKLSDVISAGNVLLRSITESAKVGDSLPVGQLSSYTTLTQSLTESLKVADALSRSMAGGFTDVSLSEGLRVSDTVTPLINPEQATPSEGLKVHDSVQTAWDSPPPPTTSSIPVLEVEGVEFGYLHTSLYITEIAVGINTADFTMLSNGSSRPALGDEVFLSDGSDPPMFGGFIEAFEEAGHGGEPTTDLTFRVTATDYNTLPTRRYVSVTLAQGSLKSQLTTMLTYLADYNVTMHPEQVDGPAMPGQFYEDKRIDEIFNEFLTLSNGYLTRINYDKQLRAVMPGEISAPFNIVNNSIGDIKVEYSRTGYANFINLFWGNGTKAVEQHFMGDGVTTSFQTTYRSTKNIQDVWPFVLIYDGIVQGPVGWGPNQLPGNHWYWDFDTRTLVNFGLPPTPAGVIVAVPYTIQLPVKVTAALVGVDPSDYIENTYTEPDILDAAIAQEKANHYLTLDSAVPRTATYVTDGKGLATGMSQTVISSKRNLSGTWMITDIMVHQLEAARVNPHIWRTVKVLEGTLYNGSWRDVYLSWSAGGSVNVGSGSGGVITSTITKSTYFLGGSGIDAVQSATPTWVPASPVRVRINSAIRGTVAARVVVRLRAFNAGVAVQARLYDATTGVDCGASEVVVSTAWTMVTFGVTLTAGEKDYELQVLPGVANEDVFAVGYVE